MKHLLPAMAVLWLLVAGMAGPAAGQIVIHGDLDMSGTIDALDEVILRNYLAGNFDRFAVQALSGELFAIDSIAGNLRFAQPGTFRQGSPAGESCREVDEVQFFHTFNNGLAVMESEVTRRMWADLLAAGGDIPPDPSNIDDSPLLDYPVQQVTFFEAVSFANALSIEQGLTPCYHYRPGATLPTCDWTADGYRLPSEGEWEYFCRAGTATPFWIEELAYAAANCAGASTVGLYPLLETAAWFAANTVLWTHPPGDKAENPWMLSHVHGNVAEWCWDRYGVYPGASTDYHGPATGTDRVIRGGSRISNACDCRSANRGFRSPDSRDRTVGFRLVRKAVFQVITY